MPTVQEHAAGGDQGAVSAKRRWVDRIRVPCLRFGRRKEKLTIDAMPLKLRPTGLGSGIDKDRPDYTVVTGEWEVGRIYETRGGPDSLRWFWSMTVRSDDTLGSCGHLGLPSRKAYSWDETWIGSGEAPKAVCYQPLVFVDVVDTAIGPPDYIEQVFDERRQNAQEAQSPLPRKDHDLVDKRTCP